MCNSGSDGLDKIYISKKACEKITGQKDKNIVIHEVCVNDKRGYEELAECTKAMSRVVNQVLQNIPRPSDACQREKTKLMSCYACEDYKPLNCSDQVKQFMECARRRSEAVVRDLVDEDEEDGEECR